MPTKVVIRAATAKEPTRLPNRPQLPFIAALSGGLLATNMGQYLMAQSFAWYAIPFLAGLVIILPYIHHPLDPRPSSHSTPLSGTSFKPKDEQEDVSLSIYPAGVQLEGNHSKPQFLPRNQIDACIVSELVYGHRVASAVLFRVSVNDKVRLVQAFPGVEMSYYECLGVRNEIKRALKL